MPRPFRFGLVVHRLPPSDWIARVRRIEALGFATLLVPDHFTTQWDPTTALGAFAAASQRMRVGSLVYAADFRHPVVLAKAAATLHLVSGGRSEFGLGAGWKQADYRAAGITMDSPGVRIERLEESLRIIRSMWSEETTSFEGRHFRIDRVARAGEIPLGERPKILIGGGGRKVLGLAGRHADIVGIAAMQSAGRITSHTARDLAPDRVREKVAWVREAAAAAGRDPDELELNALVSVLAMVDDSRSRRKALAAITGMSAGDVADCPLFLIGSAAEIRDQLERRREDTGISYVVIRGADDMGLLERFAEGVIAPLAGR